MWKIFVLPPLCATFKLTYNNDVLKYRSAPRICIFLLSTLTLAMDDKTISICTQMKCVRNFTSSIWLLRDVRCIWIKFKPLTENQMLDIDDDQILWTQIVVYILLYLYTASHRASWSRATLLLPSLSAMKL